MMEVTILTADNRPRFNVAANATAQQIRFLVARRFGWVSIGVPHSWVAKFV